MNTRHIRLHVEGLVQGVSYRASARDAALRLGVSGTVRNLPSGAVEAHAEGTAEALDHFIAWCRRGPEEALVSRVTVTEEVPVGFAGFEVVR